MTFPQAATYWASASQDGFNEHGYAEPEVVFVRWEELSKQTMDSMSQTIESKAIVYTDNQSIDIDDYLYLGESSLTNPKALDKAYRVSMRSVIPNIEGSKSLIKLWL